jgi:hypothetical protein
LSEWGALFQDITSKVIETELKQSMSIIKEYGSIIAEASGISFSSDTVLEVYNEEEVPVRLLQPDTTPTASNATAPTVPTASNTTSNSTSVSNSTNSTSSNSNASGSSKSSSSDNSKPKKTKKTRVLRPIRGRRGKNGKRRVVSNETREGGKCRGSRRKRTCSLSEFKKANSTHRANSKSLAKPRRSPVYRLRHNRTEAEARRKRFAENRRKY